MVMCNQSSLVNYKMFHSRVVIYLFIASFTPYVMSLNMFIGVVYNNLYISDVRREVLQKYLMIIFCKVM